MNKIAGQHSLNYPPSFLFRYLERLVRSLVYLPLVTLGTLQVIGEGAPTGSNEVETATEEVDEGGQNGRSCSFVG